MAAVKNEHRRLMTKRRLSRRGGKRRSKTCSRYNGGSPGRIRLNAVKLAVEALNTELEDPAQRTIVKKRLQILYGTSETWKKLRDGNNATSFNNSATFTTLPQNIKDLVQTLLNNITEVFDNPHSELEYNQIMLYLIRNNLYHLTQQEYNDRNNFENASTEYSNNSINNNNSNNGNISSPRMSQNNVSNDPINNDPKV
jgi:hypothetical protein